MKKLTPIAFAWAGLAILAGCASAGKPNPTPTERARMLIQVANAALLEGDVVGALENLGLAEAENPDLPDLHHSKALAYHAHGDLQTAIAEARLAVKLKPDYSDANNTLGKMLMDSGKLAEAEIYLNKAAKDPLNRDAFKANTALGILNYRKGEYEKARGHLDKAISQSKGLSCIAYYYRGHISVRQSRLKDAISDYDHASKKLCAAFADAHLALGIAFEQDRQFSAARKKFMEIQERYPSSKYATQAIERLQHLP